LKIGQAKYGLTDIFAQAKLRRYKSILEAIADLA